MNKHKTLIGLLIIGLDLFFGAASALGAKLPDRDAQSSMGFALLMTVVAIDHIIHQPPLRRKLSKKTELKINPFFQLKPTRIVDAGHFLRLSRRALDTHPYD